MGRFDNIAILTDLDRTFLSDSTRLVERNIEAIEYFKREGGLFSLATGRMHYNLDCIVPGVDRLVNAPAIMCNGTYFYDFAEKKVFCENYMNGELAHRAVLSAHARHKSAVIRVSYYGGYMVDSEDIRAAEELEGYGIKSYVSAPFEKWQKNGWYKIVFGDDSDTLAHIENELESEFPGVFEYNRSKPTLLEMQMRGRNKASLFSSFKKYYAEKGKELTVYVCGDNENDIELLRAADVAVCPSNAIGPVKALCDKCLCSNNEGVVADLIYSL